MGRHPHIDAINAPRRTISWFSCGAASAIATKLEAASEPTYCLTGSEHPDNERFAADCERWFGRPITRLKSERYSDTWDVWTRRRFLAGVNGALCTTELKIMVRLAYQRPDDVHVFGYTVDANDVARAERLRENFPELSIRTPLIDRGLTKTACIEMVRRAGIAVPAMYLEGFHNNNCVPCVKATSPDYWSLIRLRHPEEFWRMASLSRELDVRLCRIDGERRYIDEIPEDWPTGNPIAPSCDFLCAIAEFDMVARPAANGAE